MTWIYVWWPKTDYSAMQWPAPSGFHVPLNTEWQAVKDIWTALGGWSNDWANFWIALKLPFAGYRFYTSAGVSYQGTQGRYWSSSRYNANSAYNLYFKSSSITPQNGYNRAGGFSVRCFKNSPTIPTSSWTKLYWTSIESWWIFWSSADWLISLSSDWNTWITIQDKNLWATTVWNSGDTLSKANCGKYYQRWNNYWFPFTWSVTTSSTQVDASAYWPWNYYSSSTFITRSSSPYRWDTTDNANLRWWETWIVERTGEVKSIYVWTTPVKEVFVWTTKVRPSGWTPWANTLLYMPMTKDFKDKTGNNTITNSWATITTVDGIKCWYFNSNRLTCSNTPLSTTNQTISVWLKTSSSSGWWIIWSNHSGIYSWDLLIVNTSKIYWVYMDPSWKDIYASSWATSNTWINVIVSWKKIYLNWIDVTSNTQTWTSITTWYAYTIWQQNSWALSYIWYMSELILENKARTAQEISDYYNSTKSNYGL